VAFDPLEFLETGRLLLGQASGSEATFRTVCGRAYYAVYGTIRGQLSQARSVPPDHLFGRAGRHGDLINALNLGSAQFKSVGIQYRRLHIARVSSDYDYAGRVTRHDAERALSDAEWVASRLNNIPEQQFRSFPLAPPQRRSTP
jgi:hypothetical protein